MMTDTARAALDELNLANFRAELDKLTIDVVRELYSLNIDLIDLAKATTTGVDVAFATGVYECSHASLSRAIGRMTDGVLRMAVDTCRAHGAHHG